ncbi:DUF3526 domain-containing protein [Aquimarina muelleri]|uniref:ABC-2 type transport system permease protein n=1 Tax=Aquimarina muelleri TaxID=279356 RepID=A0A918JYG6_9FLAO|nr:DUF3526 domain-containing protein [Aquimarina muelleri]MCX2764814.1 DUF3526 domain-containing protein [Aquimarina muelleri]GGX34112.1 hypothetical protein GCM10007384_38460 [Aquimarina muelleri]
MTRLVFHNFIRSNSVKIGLLFLLLTGIISLFIGKQFLEKQKQNIIETDVYQKEQISRNVEFHKDDIGLLLYYLKFSLVNKTPEITGLSIGQRDVNASIKSVSILGLEGQKYDTELNNPYNLLLGNLDFSFVLIFLFPLVIIAFTFNIISEEKESGTWRIVSVQSKTSFKIILQLFLVRFLSILGVFLLIFFLAIPILNIPINASFWGFMGMSIGYILVWFGICFGVASLHKNSNFNAVILFSIWIFLIIILPATVNNYLVSTYPVPEALETTLQQRKGYHEKWDMDKKTTMDKFFAHYPQFKNFPKPENGFNWLWYYAMQQMGDDESAQYAKELQEKLEQRTMVSSNIARFIPTLHMQIQLNEIAKSGLKNQLNFLEATNKFHEKNRLYFYPKIFKSESVESENWKAFQIENFSDEKFSNSMGLYVPLLVFILFFGVFGWFNFNKNKGLV